MSAIFIKTEYNKDSGKDMRTAILECIELAKTVKVPVKIKFERNDKYGSTELTIKETTKISDFDDFEDKRTHKSNEWDSGIPPYRKNIKE